MHVDACCIMYTLVCMYTCVGCEHRVNMCVWYEHTLHVYIMLIATTHVHDAHSNRICIYNTYMYVYNVHTQHTSHYKA